MVGFDMQSLTAIGNPVAWLYAKPKNGGVNGFTLKNIISDSTSVNTSPNVGAIRYIELDIGRAIQWIICMLHFAELPFK